MANLVGTILSVPFYDAGFATVGRKVVRQIPHPGREGKGSSDSHFDIEYKSMSSQLLYRNPRGRKGKLLEPTAICGRLKNLFTNRVTVRLCNHIPGRRVDAVTVHCRLVSRKIENSRVLKLHQLIKQISSAIL